MKRKNKLQKIKEDLKKKHEGHLFKSRMRGKTRTEIIQQMDEDRLGKLFLNAIPLKEFFGISGVYYLFQESKLVYIGESACIFTRISQHLGIKRFDHFKYIVIAGEKERKMLEKNLIRKHRPLYNLVYNESVTL